MASRPCTCGLPATRVPVVLRRGVRTLLMKARCDDCGVERAVRVAKGGVRCVI